MCPKRRYYKFRSNKDKYSIEQTNFATAAINTWTQIPAEDDTQITSYLGN